MAKLPSNFLFLAVAVAISGCAYKVTLMPRDSGVTYTGALEGAGGTGSMTVMIDGDVCTGPAARVASNESFGYARTYAQTNKGSFAAATTNTYTTGDANVKALLSCKSGKGFRCDLTGRGASGGGICLDDQGKVYDAIVVRQ